MQWFKCTHEHGLCVERNECLPSLCLVPLCLSSVSVPHEQPLELLLRPPLLSSRPPTSCVHQTLRSLRLLGPPEKKVRFLSHFQPRTNSGNLTGLPLPKSPETQWDTTSKDGKEKEVLSLANREVKFEGVFWRSCQFLLVAWLSLREMPPRDLGAAAWIQLVWLSPASEKLRRERRVYYRHWQVCSVHEEIKLFYAPGESCLICCLNKPVTTWH